MLVAEIQKFKVSVAFKMGKKNGRKGEYTQAREFDAEGKPVKDIDFTDHGRGHPNPHQHKYLDSSNGKGTGSRKRSKKHDPLKID